MSKISSRKPSAASPRDSLDARLPVDAKSDRPTPDDAVGRALVTHLNQLTWLTADEVAQYLRLPSRKAVYEWVRRGLLPSRRLGRRVLFNREEVDAALKSTPTFNDVSERSTMPPTPVCRGRRK